MRQVPEAVTEYLIHFHGDRDWFECHEILEEYWKNKPDATEAESSTLVGLIQIAVGLYHERRGNRAGAFKMLRSSLSRLDGGVLEKLGLDAEELMRRIRERAEPLEQGASAAFADMDLPFADAELEAICRKESEARGWGWKLPSRTDDIELVERHTRRDRSEVVRERERSKLAKREAHLAAGQEPEGGSGQKQ
jgi:predicted metal-dependent hydrolase